MSHPARKKHRRRTQPGGSFGRTVRLIAILSFACLAIIAVIFAVVESAPPSLGKHSQTAGACNPTLIATGNQTEKWFSINSGSGADILSAAKCTDMYQSALQGNDPIAAALRAGTLAAPVLVKPYRSDAGLSQYWVVPVVNTTTNYPLAFLTLLYEPQSRLIHEGEFDAVTGNMFYVNHTFPAVTANAAVASVSARQHVAMVQGRAAELIYFPVDFAGIQAGTNHWTAGGTSVIDPIWRLPGVDGRWHFVDHNGQAHFNTDLPVDPSYLPMPNTTNTQ